MKILFAAFRYDYGIKARNESLEMKAFFPALERTGNEIIPFWLEDNGYPDGIDALQDKLVQYAEISKPDIIFFILMNDEIRTSTIELLSAKYLTVNWFCDDQWRFNSFSKFVSTKLSHVITVDKYSLNDYAKLGCEHIIRSQWAAVDYQENLKFDTLKYKYEVSFIGAKNLTREWLIKELKKRNIEVACFGSGWPNGKVSYDQMKDIFMHSKINLNLSNSVSSDFGFFKYLLVHPFRLISQIFAAPSTAGKLIRNYLSYVRFFFFSKKKIEQMKARNFEIPGFGGFQLSQFSLEIEDYYKIGEEIALFSNVADLERQILYFLASEDEREQIRSKGYLRTSEHTYEKRLKAVFAQIKG